MKHLIYLFLLSTKSVKDNFMVRESAEREYLLIDAELDPTAFIVGTVRALRLKDMKFTVKNTGAKNLTLLELLQKYEINCYKENDNIVKDIINDIVKYHKDLIWFLLKHTDITYNVIKRTVSYFIYYSDANLQARTAVEYRTPYHLFKKFYLLFLEKLGEETQRYMDTVGLAGYANRIEPNTKQTMTKEIHRRGVGCTRKQAMIQLDLSAIKLIMARIILFCPL